MPVTLPPTPPPAIVQIADAAAQPPLGSADNPGTSLPSASPHAGSAGTAAGASADQPHLLGDWLGARTWLEDHGITPRITYIWFPAYNLDGGTRKKVRQAGQLAVGATLDMQKLAGIKGGTVQVTISNRNGININDANHLGLLQYPQGIYGAGEIWRLADFWYQQKIGPAEIKLGRVTVGEDRVD